MTKSDLLKTAKPILFNTDMVRAILDERKSMTRRCVKFKGNKNPNWTGFILDGLNLYNGNNEICNKKLQFMPGDILYVRETWNYGYWDSSDFEYQVNETWFEELPIGKKTALGEGHYVYRSNIEPPELKNLERKNDDGYRGISWHPSIHMPKKAARIFLRVTDVRVERLQDITAKEAFLEGVGELFLDDIAYSGKNYGCDWDAAYGLSREQFAWLWDSTIPKKQLETYGWDANPWVWVIEFERIEVGE